MSEFVTVARPYAKAAFDFAVEHQSLDRWQSMLAFTAEVTRNEQIEELRKQVAILAVAGAEKIIERSVDEAANSDIVDKLVAEL